MEGTLYLIPTTLGDSPIEKVIPQELQRIIKSIPTFIVEDLRSARRYLKKLDRSIVIDDLTFLELNKHTSANEIGSYLDHLSKGPIGIISEAGCPGVADPGADIVKIAHQKKIRVVPIVGPSSILLSLMASGMNGQNFAFLGYLPIKRDEQIKRLANIERRSQKENQTQIFIEAPFRNNRLLETIVKNCSDNTRLCVAVDITLETESIQTKTIAQWRNNLPELHKRPTIFLLHKD